MFKQFQELRGINPAKNGFYEIPECYRTVETEMEEALFFEDLKVSGFEMFDRHKEVTVQFTLYMLYVLRRHLRRRAITFC